MLLRNNRKHMANYKRGMPLSRQTQKWHQGKTNANGTNTSLLQSSNVILHIILVLDARRARSSMVALPTMS